MLLAIRLPSRSAKMIPENESSVRIRSLDSFATSVAEERDIPIDAFESANESFTPSPVIATTMPRFEQSSISLSLCSGVTRENTLRLPSLIPL